MVKILQVEQFWTQRSRITWLNQGGANTRFYHLAAKIFHGKTKILSLLTEEGETLTNQSDLDSYCYGTYKSWFTAADTSFYPGGLSLPRYLDQCISQQENTSLNEIPTNNEIRRVVFSINPNKAPGPDSFNAKFYQTFWPTLKPDLIRMVSDFFTKATIDTRLNETILILIPKKEGHVTIKDYRPISLCDVVYKIH